MTKKEQPKEISVYEKGTDRFVLSTQAPKEIQQLEGAITFLEGREINSLTIKGGYQLTSSSVLQNEITLEVEFGYCTCVNSV